MDSSVLTRTSNYKEEKDIFFKNLILLGFDVPYNETKHSITFNAEMFNLPNKKGFQVVTHFLFSKLNEICDNKYKIIWPLNKAQELEFRKICFSHLTKISKDDIGGIPFPHFAETLFVSACGNRFYDIYFAFSSYVLHKSALHYSYAQLLCRPTVKEQNYEDARRISQLGTIKSYKEFVKSQQQSLQNHQTIQDKTDDFVSHYRLQKEMLMENEKLIDESLSLLITKWSKEFGYSLPQKALIFYLNYSSEKHDELANMWDSLNNCFSETEIFWNVVESVLALKNSDGSVLCGENILDRPESEQNAFQSCIEDGQVSTQRFMALYFETLEQFLKTLKEATPCHANGLSQTLAENVHSLGIYQEELKCNREKLEHVYLPKVAKSIEELESSKFFDSTSSFFESTVNFPPLMSVPNFSMDLSVPTLPEMPLELSPVTPCTYNDISPKLELDINRPDLHDSFRSDKEPLKHVDMPKVVNYSPKELESSMSTDLTTLTESAISSHPSIPVSTFSKNFAASFSQDSFELCPEDNMDFFEKSSRDSLCDYLIQDITMPSVPDF